jgi:uncharacterized delta-60 repeat protein
MSFFLPSKRKYSASGVRFVRPRLESLEDRFLLSSSPTLEPGFNRIVSELGLMNVKEIVLPDGKILVGGTAFAKEFPGGYQPPGLLRPAILWPGQALFSLTRQIELVRFNADGSLDTSFGTGGMVSFQPGVSDTFEDFALQTDGDVVVVGTNSMHGFHYENQPSVVNGETLSFTIVEQDYEMLVARFTPDGVLDKSFNGNGDVITSGAGTDTYGMGVVIQGNGGIVVSGQYGTYTTAGLVARYNRDGTVDSSFNSGGTQPGIVTISLGSNTTYNEGGAPGLALESDGSIVVVFGLTSSELNVYRLNADGSYDFAFGSGGVATYPYPANTLPNFRALAVQPDGKIVVANDDVFGGLLLLRFDADGSLDTSFGHEGSVTVAGIGSYTQGWLWQITGGLVVQSEGRIVVARASEPVPATELGPELLKVFRFNADGSRDTSFGVDGEAESGFGPIPPDATLVALSASAALTPGGSVVAVGSIESVSFLSGPMFEPFQLMLVDYGDQPARTPPAIPLPVSAPTPAPVASTGRLLRAVSEPLASGVGTASDAVFQSLAAGTRLQHLATIGSRPAVGPPTAPPPAPSLPTPLPVASTSQTSAVARTSGGGGETVAADDVFNLTGGPEREFVLTLAGTEE